MAERIILDPEEVATDRTEFDMTCWIDAEGIDWGDAEIQAYMSEAGRIGDNVLDYRVPNRQIQGGLVFGQTQGTVTPKQAREKLEKKLALIQREGGWLQRVTESGGTVYADLTNATLHATSVSGWESRGSIDVQSASFTLEAIPEFYEAEAMLGGTASTTTASELIFTRGTISGDYPARCRIVVNNDEASQDYRGLLWSLRSRHYGTATTEQMEYEAEELNALGNAANYGLAGASGGTIVRSGTIFNEWMPILNTNIGGTTWLTHTGTNRVFARCYYAGDTDINLRLRWGIGDMTHPVTNDYTHIPVKGTAFGIADLGEVRLDPAPVGTHRWQGQIEAKTSDDTSVFGVDKVWILNADEGMGRLRAPNTAGAADLTLAAIDDFSTPRRDASTAPGRG